jgi:NTE family protein
MNYEMKKVVILCAGLLFQLTLSAQKQVYKNLVLEGGGVKGFAYAGAFQVLDSLGLLGSIERVGGTSAGAIQATLLAIGYTPNEMMQIAGNIPLKEFNDGFLAGGLSRMKKRFGFFKGEKLTEWIEKLIGDKTGDANITFLQLHQLKPQKKYLDLYITGTDLTNRCLRVFSFESYPNMRIKDALRISFSIPLYFQPVYIDNNGSVQKQTKTTNFSLMVDGGLLANYPIQIFDSTKYFATNATVSNTYQPNPQTLGLLLDNPERVKYNNQQQPSLVINNLREYMKAVYQTIIDKPNPDVGSNRRTVIISDLNLSGRVRKLPPATIQKLVESGRQGVRTFFLH